MLEPKPREFVPADFNIKNKEELLHEIELLNQHKVDTEEELHDMVRQMSELESVVSEQIAWIQVRMTTDTSNKQYEEDFQYVVSEINPILSKAFFELNKKIIENPNFKTLTAGSLFPYYRQVEGEVKIFRDDNIPLQSEESLKSQTYGQITGAMSIEYQGEEYTLQQAAKYLESDDRSVRENVYRAIQQRRGENEQELMDLFMELLSMRDQIAKNADFENYQQYKWIEMGRYDYTPQDCTDFHESIKKYFLPLYNKLLTERKEKLGLDKLRPWDLEAPLPHERQLTPFSDGQDLVNKSITMFGRMESFFEDCIVQMDSMDRFDMDSRKNKAPGGYNCPMAETGVPFIFMNSVGTADDVITMMHESGHAFHSFLSYHLPLYGEKEYPMEIAELASMSMELMSMDYWDTFYSHKKDLEQARAKELERVISVLPWVATIDKFQQYLYTTPDVTPEKLTEKWLEIHAEFTPEVLDWSGLEDFRKRLWQKQLHLYEVPFYYIEYGIAQLGAISMWRNYKMHPSKTLKSYKNALSMGYTMTLPQLYETAGIEFDFGAENVEKLANFLSEFI